jgi:hypothetical protein
MTLANGIHFANGYPNNVVTPLSECLVWVIHQTSFAFIKAAIYSADAVSPDALFDEVRLTDERSVASKVSLKFKSWLPKAIGIMITQPSLTSSRWQQECSAAC